MVETTKHRQIRLEKKKEYYYKNKEKIRGYNYQRYLKKGEEYKQYSKEWYQKHKNLPQFKKKNRYRSSHWYQQNKERTKIRDKIYYQKNKEHKKMYDRQYIKRKEVRERINNFFKTKIGRIRHRAYYQTRIARKNNVIHTFNIVQWRIKCESTKGRCPNPYNNSGCLGNVGIEKLTLDHIYPLTRAHKDFLTTEIKRIYTIHDVQPLCRSCNSSKNAKVLQPVLQILPSSHT